MTRYLLTDEDRRKGALTQTFMGRAVKAKREAELVLLNRLLAELAMPEMLSEL